MAFEPPRRLLRALGETAPGGDDWLARLPGTARDAVERRGSTVERVQEPGGRSSLVVLVRLADGAPAVLKLAPPRARPESERAALAHWAGRGAVRLLEPAGPDGELLLERLHPDVSVRSLPEARALLEAAGTLRRLWVEPPADHSFETVAERTGRQAAAMRATAAARPEVAQLVDAALMARDELLEAGQERRLLHGTFRQSKVLAGERSPWLAVGPDPVVGECAFDLARLVRDRVEDLIAVPSGASTARRRVKRLAESLDVDQDRLRGWALFRAVESGVRALRVGRPKDAELLLEFAGWL
ncbi:MULTISPECIES: aminoglycoside phosphotransferase family protein [Streptomyces]|uniref:Aminoglycoside phosphotransferase family protein n=1 Tax=Streptomyces doudnae TaxID=3075536 RepID=A0ABD5EYR7_9ACTN|nr:MULTISPECIES: aminoglycoside phosphotransferase family protein [unclassified Streptomyces]MDT0439916.1 aminoglycoside phosphotransferase family protein [Streptomyces sp. DSM 41981]MYQ66077.1 kinase [Streptomyces sp. SID4950]SCE13868.1 streptomycin 6-kinase [Streptomyces sp. SolWspMP-5a-2]